MGSDGTVGANKEAVKIIAAHDGMHAQVGRTGFFGVPGG
jgi:Pyruvate/2-oxoacid:ferredoxin oxidoreductase gamma subunit